MAAGSGCVLPQMTRPRGARRRPYHPDVDQHSGTRSSLPLWLAVAPALSALAMIGELTSEHDGPFPRWADVLVLVGTLSLVTLLCLHWVLRRRR